MAFWLNSNFIFENFHLKFHLFREILLNFAELSPLLCRNGLETTPPFAPFISVANLNDIQG